MQSTITILSAPIQTGKTTSTIEWAKKQNNVYGIVQPIINNKRHLIDIASNETKLLEANASSENTITIGKFNFYKSVFEWAKICLLYSLNKNPEYLIIDELGKLELNNKGLEPAVNYIINEYKITMRKNLILVVRDYLLDDINTKYDLSTCRVISKIDEL